LVPDDTTAAPEVVVDLQRQLAACRAELERRTKERDGALARETAAAEVLHIVSGSSGDLAPVFEAMLDKALTLCGAAFGVLWTYDGERIHAAAVRGFTENFRQFFTRTPHPVGPDNAHGRLLRGEPLVHIADAAQETAFRSGDPLRRALVESGGRTLIAVPLRKEDRFLGDFVLYRQEVRPFSGAEIALLQNFAAQAVIAMENARVLGELRERTRDLQESLEYQTATSEVLKIISRSTFDLQPVLETLVQTAARLCRADVAGLNIREGEVYRSVARIAHSQDADAFSRDLVFTPSRGTVTGRAALDRKPVHVADIAADPDYALPGMVTIRGVRTALGIPLLREGEPIGVVFLARQRVEPFSEQQIELVRTFADQAVIAIENSRLLAELREALQQQTATAEILQVMNSSLTDVQPVFEAIANSAAWLCNALNSSVYRCDGELIHFMAESSFSATAVETTRRLFPAPPSRDNGTARAVADCAVVHIPDVVQDPDYRSLDWANAIGLRGVLSVPMLRDGRPIGVITVNRAEPGFFPQSQVELLKTFADQAVIAIENTRLLTELRERTDELARRELELRVRPHGAHMPNISATSPKGASSAPSTLKPRSAATPRTWHANGQWSAPGPMAASSRCGTIRSRAAASC
jgi:two-component system, NtrC family, sensor kinase